MTNPGQSMTNPGPCKDCVPPKRQIGCHGYCEEYIEWKAGLERQKQAEKEWKELHPELFYKFTR